MRAAQPVESIFARAWQLLARNPVIIVPGLIIGLLEGVLTYLLVPAPGATGGIVASAVVVVAFIATQAFTVGMAGAAWQRGVTTPADGVASFERDAGRIVMTAVGLVLLGFVAAVLAIFTLGLSLLAFVLLTLYAFPAAVVGERDGFGSIAESFAIARARLGTTLIIAVVLFVVAVVVSLAAVLFAFVPVVGPVVSACIEQAIVAFATLVLVGEYLDATRQPS